MKQILQSLNDGRVDLANIPVPQIRKGHLLVQTRKSLVSPGTEKMLLEFGRANLINKARQQPEKVVQAVQKIKTDGLLPTIEAIQSKLSMPIPLGYSNVGTVIAVGEGATEFQVGDRVVSNGSHAEVVCVPKNLCAKIPNEVSDDEAAFTVLGAIALQGMRLSQPTLGETFVVIGLGLLGQLTVQLLRANGVHVLAMDFAPDRLDLAKSFGAEVFDLNSGDPIPWVQQCSEYGIDAAIITTATDSHDPIHWACEALRKRGRIVLTGVTGLNLQRSDFFKKEITFQVSCSYGPGRYDSNYEEKGLDYPIGFVRWTEQRNFQAILSLLSEKRLNVESLTSSKIPFSSAAEFYSEVANGKKGLGFIFEYPNTVDLTTKIKSVQIPSNSSTSKPERISIGFIGAGAYASRFLLPALTTRRAKNQARLHTIVSRQGITAHVAASKFGFENESSNLLDVMENPEINTVFIATRHDTHAELIKLAIQNRKNVFVEKPLALTLTDVDEIEDILKSQTNPPKLLVGFNRRFSPLATILKSEMNNCSQAKNMVYTVNAGAVPSDHWTQDKSQGGDRIVGEACHFIDLIYFFMQQPLEEVRSQFSPSGTSIHLSFEKGGLATIHYLTNGHKSFPKERLEIFSDGNIWVLDNFKNLNRYGGFSKKLWSQNKGNEECVNAFLKSIHEGTPNPIPWPEIIAVSRASILASPLSGSARPPLANDVGQIQEPEIVS